MALYSNILVPLRVGITSSFEMWISIIIFMLLVTHEIVGKNYYKLNGPP